MVCRYVGNFDNFIIFRGNRTRERTRTENRGPFHVGEIKVGRNHVIAFQIPVFTKVGSFVDAIIIVARFRLDIDFLYGIDRGTRFIIQRTRMRKRFTADFLRAVFIDVRRNERFAFLFREFVKLLVCITVAMVHNPVFPIGKLNRIPIVRFRIFSVCRLVIKYGRACQCPIALRVLVVIFVAVIGYPTCIQGHL